MKMSKLFPVLCVFAMGANCLTVRAEDNPAQATARAALAKQLFEMGGPPPAATNATPANSSACQKEDWNTAMAPVNSKDAKAKGKAEKAAAADLKAKQEADKKLAAQQAAEAKDAVPKQAASGPSEAEKAALSAAFSEKMAADAQVKSAPQTATNPPPAKAK